MTASLGASPSRRWLRSTLHSGELAKGEQAARSRPGGRAEGRPAPLWSRRSPIRPRRRAGWASPFRNTGAKSRGTRHPILAVAGPADNPDPAPINYTAFRRVLDDFRRDLSTADETLAGVADDEVKLRLRLAAVRLDLAGDGKPTDKFIDILKKIMKRQNFGFLESNPDFLVCFDRGDVAWLRAYCHLLMGMLDFYLAFDTEEFF